MVKSAFLAGQRQNISLTARVSAFLALAAIIPLLIAVVSSQLLSRPQLVSQSADAMSLDAQTRVQLIDAYLQERLHDAETISRLPSLQKFLLGDEQSRQVAFDEFSAGDQRDANYDSWSLLNLQGNLLLWYPTQPHPHGKYLILPEAMQKIQQTNQATISDVFYNSSVSEASVDIYMPVITPTAQMVGVVRATLSLNYIWNIINAQADKPDSYAFLLDQNGVRIGYTNTDVSNITQPQPLFKAIAPLSPQMQQRIKDENLYGSDKNAVTELPESKLVEIQRDAHPPAIFDMTPGGQNNAFKVARESSKIVPWTYFELSPLSTITAIADQQLLYICIIAALVFVLAGALGVNVGRRITKPILLAVSSLLNSSQSLKKLAAKEEVTATEQKWMIESSQVGVKSVQYYTDATSMAARQLSQIGTELLGNLHRIETLAVVEQKLQEIVAMANYIENAAIHQNKSNRSLSTAIKVTTNVTEQLASGAASATEASAQLEQVVERLRQIVGQQQNGQQQNGQQQNRQQYSERMVRL